MTLTEFLLARIGEDEAVARAAIGTAAFQRQTGKWRSEVLPDGRRIVFAVADGGAKTQVRCEPYSQPCPTLSALALPYAQHPDYTAARRWL